MPSSYTPYGGFTLQATGEGDNTWGVILNEQAINLISQGIYGFVSVYVSATTSYTLTSQNGAEDQGRQPQYRVSGPTGGDLTLIIPNYPSVKVIHNTLSSGNSIILKTAAGQGVTIANGHRGVFSCDGVTVTPIFYADAGGQVVKNVGTPVSSTDAVTKAYADGLLTGLSLSNLAAPTGNVSWAGYRLTNLGTAVQNNDAVPLAQVLNLVNSATGTTGTLKVTGNDTTFGYLSPKVSAVSPLFQTVLSASGAEQLGIFSDKTSEKGNVLGSVPCTLADASYFTMTVTGSTTIDIPAYPSQGVPSGTLQMYDAGSYTTSFPADWKWVSTNGTVVDTFASSGYTLQTGGTDFVIFWKPTTASTVYAKVIR